MTEPADVPAMPDAASPAGAADPGSADTGSVGRPGTRAVRDARLAWILGGSLLIAYSAIGLLLGGYWNFVPGGWLILDLLWAAAMLLFAFGIRRSGSVVARRTLGVVALVVAAVQPLMTAAVWAVVPIDPENLAPAQMLGQALTVIMLASLVVATVVIARAGAVPHRVRWVPFIVLAVVAGSQLLLQAVFASSAASQVAGLTSMVFAVTALAPLGLLVLGILAIVLAPRESPRPAPPTQVFPPSS